MFFSKAFQEFQPIGGNGAIVDSEANTTLQHRLKEQVVRARLLSRDIRIVLGYCLFKVDVGDEFVVFEVTEVADALTTDADVFKSHIADARFR